MAIRVGTHDAKTNLSEYLNRAAYRGERFLIERHGKPVAALVGVADLELLECGAQHGQSDPGGREAEFRRRARERGIIIRYPSGPPVERKEWEPLRIPGPPLSEDIVADRR